MSASTAKYNVRERLKAKGVVEEEGFGNTGLGCDVTTDTNTNDSFNSSDESGALERLDLPLRNTRLDFGQKKSVPDTPARGFAGRNIDTELASGRSRFSSSASTSPSKARLLRRVLAGSNPPSANANTMKNWRKDTPISAVPPTPARSETAVAATPRRVPAGVEVTDLNAQKFYSTKECLFVANLPLDPYDHDLQAELTAAFKPHGTCYIKIQRDVKRMPQAFVQYTCREDAEKAMEATKGLQVRGRVTRIEWSKANREYHLSRKDGTVVSEETAREFLAPYGAIETIARVDTAASDAGLSTSGVLVIFENYQSGRDAVRVNQESDEWKVVEHDRDGARKKAALIQSLKGKRSQAEIDEYSVDRKSIFLGNLRETTNEYAIRQLCKDFGKVLGVDINIRPSTRDGCDKNVFAYVEFTNAEEVKAAIVGLRGRPYKGQRLKVDQKKSPEVLYGKDGKDGKSATQDQTNKWAQLPRTSLQVAPSSIGQFGQNGIAASPFSPAPYDTPLTGYASPFHVNAYGSPAAFGRIVQSAGGGRLALPPNLPHPYPGQQQLDIQTLYTNYLTPPQSGGYPFQYPQGQMYSGASPGYGFEQQLQACGQKYYGLQPQQQLVPGTPMSGGFQTRAPSPLAPPVYAASYANSVFPKPCDLAPFNLGSILPPNVQFSVHAGSAATAQETVVNPGDHAYGRAQDVPAVEGQSKVDAAIGETIDEGVKISPPVKDTPNQACSVSDIVG